LLGHVDTAVKGATLNKEKIKNIPIFFPAALREQEQISAILATADESISKTEALIAKLSRIRLGLMHDLLTRGIDEGGNIRSEKTHHFKDSPLGQIPVEWEARPLRDCLQYISYGFTNPMPETEDGPYMVTATNIFDGRVQYESCRHTSEYAFRNLLTKKSRPIHNDILLTKDGSLGRLALVDRSEICINQSVAVLRPEKTVSSGFVKSLLEAPNYQKSMDDDAGGSTIRHIYITRVAKMPIAVPRSTKEQAKICSMLSQANCLVEAEIAYRDKLCSLKRGLMEDLLSGKVRVNRLLKQ
jgi:type I restriction enzyme S subunit